MTLEQDTAMYDQPEPGEWNMTALIAELRAAVGDSPDDMTWEEDLFARATDGLDRLTREMHARELHHFETEQLLTEQGIDPDKWEYGIRPEDDGIPLGVSPMPTLDAAQTRADNIRGGWVIVRRRPAGPWLPLTQEGEDQ